jgi:hypothetical protein
MTLSKKEQELVYIGWKSYEKRDELEEGLIETYSTELAKLNEIKEKIVSNA